MSYFDELKRRNVFRVAAAYIVAAWLALQVIDVVGPIMDLPNWVPRTALLVLIIGFPAALILAWAFELTPRGIQRDDGGESLVATSPGARRKLDVAVIAVLTLAVFLFAVDKFVWTGSPDADGRNSIAVLPFVSISEAGNNEYFADGLAEEIISLLSRMPDLRVIGRTSSFSFKNQDVDAQTIGATLNVRSVLEGSVRIDGDRLRITARLIDTMNASQLWADDYDRVLSDVFAVQDDVAAAIIDALQVQIGVVPSRGVPTRNQDALRLFYRARAELNSFLFKEAEQTLLEVLALDPNYAEAYELQAYAYWFLSATTFDAAEGQQLVGAAAARALAIDPSLTLASVLDVSANSRPYSVRAEIEALEQALTIQIDDPRLLDILMFRLIQTGYFEEAVSVGERFVEADPISAVAHNRLSEALYAVGRVGEAFSSARVVDDLDQTSDTAYWNLAHMSLAEGQDEDAIRYFASWLQQFDLGDVSWVRELIAGARDPVSGEALLDARVPEIIASLPVDNAFEIGGTLESWYLYFDHIDRFIENIFRLDVTRDTWTNAEVPVWQGTLFRRLGFTGNPRYLELAEAMGYVELWDERGAPDFCRQSAGSWRCD